MKERLSNFDKKGQNKEINQEERKKAKLKKGVMK